MALDLKENSGLLFKNKRKNRDDPETEKWSDYQGEALIDGQSYWMNAWIKESRSDGSKFMSLSFNLKEQKSQAISGGSKSNRNDMDDEIPF